MGCGAINVKNSAVEEDIEGPLSLTKYVSYSETKVSFEGSNPQCYLDIQINSKPPFRLVFELFGKICPKTVENFRQLCTGEFGRKHNRPEQFCYRGTKIHRIVKGVIIQGGNVTEGTTRGGCSIYGQSFEDESFTVKHYRRGILSMANRGPGTNASQFFITLRKLKSLDRKHVVLGKCIEGMEHLKDLSELGSDSKEGEVNGSVVVYDCGELKRGFMSEPSGEFSE